MFSWYLFRKYGDHHYRNVDFTVLYYTVLIFLFSLLIFGHMTSMKYSLVWKQLFFRSSLPGSQCRILYVYNYGQFLGLFTYIFLVNGQTHRPPYTLLPKKYRFTVDIVNVHWPAIFNMMFYCSQQYAHPESGQFWWMLHSHLVKKVKLIKNLSKVMEKRRTTW